MERFFLPLTCLLRFWTLFKCIWIIQFWQPLLTSYKCQHPFFTLTKILAQALHFHIHTFFANYKPSSCFFSCKIQSLTFPFGCRLPFMVINFLVLMSILFNSSFVQSNNPNPYLIIPTIHLSPLQDQQHALVQTKCHTNIITKNPHR